MANRKQEIEIKNYDIANSNDTIELAQDIAKFIKENNLSQQIQGKEYVNVEGWSYAGARLGILPIVEQLERIPHETIIKYQAKVKLINLRTGEMCGAGFAICTNAESGKRNYQEFALASMAQTRAVGKAYRNMLAWIIRAAGYSPTPSEEMDYDTPENNNDMSKEELELSKLKIQLMTLLFHKSITQAEKELVVEKINNFSVERIKKAIAHYENMIIERSVKPETDLEKQLKKLHSKAIDLNMSDIVEAIDRRLESGSGEEKEIKELIANVEEEIKRRESEVQNA